MKLFSSAKSSRRGSAWLLGLVLIALSWLLPGTAHATHLRAGEIQAKVDTTAAHNPYRIFFKLTLYRDPSPGKAPFGPVTVFFGDGTSTTVNLTPPERVAVPNFINVATYLFEHTYPGIGNYTVGMVDVNRIAGVVNMASSVNQSFWVSTNITVDPGLGLNRLPVITAPAIDQAAVGQVFKHSPAAYDADHDSLAYRLTPCRQLVGVPNQIPANYFPNPTVCTGFVLPNDVSIGINGGPPLTVPYVGQADSPGDPTGGKAAVFSQDARTGMITWNAPAVVGIYNIAYVVEEWRRIDRTHYNKIGEVVRDMQINVVATNNLPPTITIPNDTCVIAGAQLLKKVSAIDNASATSQAATAVQLFAYSGIKPPATFVQTQTGPPRSVGVFTWNTSCNDIAALPYIVVFKAQDTPSPSAPGNPPLIDEKTWRVTVIGPAPTNLRAILGGPTQVLLSWNNYPCQAVSTLGELPMIQIYRRENCFAYTPSPCETGIPASAGYTRIATVPANLTAYADNTVLRGHTYSYRIYVTFPLPAGGASIVSNEACITLNGRSAQITNVDVLATGTNNGQIAVKWTQPRPTTGTAFNAPLGYRLSRSSTGAAPFTLVATKTSLADTTFTDTGLNTQTLQYTYQLVFFSATTTQPGSTETTETSALASSVRLNVTPVSLSSLNTLTWQYNVPWDNSVRPTIIYRRVGAANTGPYTQLATVTPATGATSATYSDQGLTKGETYCYYVQTNGQYPAPVNSAGQLIYTNLLNRSQENCVVLNPTPCTPVLTLTPTNCDSLANVNQTSSTFDFANQRYQNRLRWTLGNTPAGCSSDVAYFRIFYRSTADGTLALLDSTTQYTYLHRNLLNGAGCYAVQAVNSAGVRSALSNIACQDNCVFFLLPNIFTPNGDNVNDKFRPKTASPIVRTHIQIFNRWGRKVYEGDKDPYINWDGGGSMGEIGTSGKASDGIYYYLADVEFADFAGTKRTFKGWVEIVR